MTHQQLANYNRLCEAYENVSTDTKEIKKAADALNGFLRDLECSGVLVHESYPLELVTSVIDS